MHTHLTHPIGACMADAIRRQVGTMNLFVVFRQEDGTLELVTPPLDGMILPGVTRDSVLSLARSHAAGTLRIPNLTTKLVVSERGVTMKEVCEAVQSSRLVEMFGAGESCHRSSDRYY
jgi:branched-chain amino acid aminotransferase